MHREKLRVKDKLVSVIIGSVLRIRKTSKIRADGKTVKKMRRELDWLGRVVAKCHPLAGVTETEIAGVAAERISFETMTTDRLLLYFHGGGYAIGSPVSHRAMISRIAWSMKAEAIVPDYRLAPENPYPAGLDDAVSVYKAVASTMASPDKLIIAGDSAGGGMALALTQRIKREGLPMPGLVCCLSPWADLTQSGETQKLNHGKDTMLSESLLDSFATLYVSESDRKEPTVSPVFGDFSGLPPVLIQVGTREVLLDDSRKIARAVEAAGGDVTFQEWRDMQHVWQFNYSVLEKARHAVKAIGQFVDEKLQDLPLQKKRTA